MNNLSDRIRAANPDADRPLPERVLASLDDIMTGHRVPRRAEPSLEPSEHRRWRPATLAGVSVVSLCVLIAVMAFVAIRPQPAVAATPTPLHLAATESTVETLREGAMNASIPSGSAGSTRGAAWEGWFLQLDADKPSATYIQPQRTEMEWRSDLSGTSRIIAGVPTTPDGVPLEEIPTTADTPGATLYEEQWETGELAVPFVDAPPDDSAAMREYLDRFLEEQGLSDGEGTAAGNYLFAATALLQVWTLSDSAQHAVVQVLLSAPGVEVTGAATDRAGRDGIALAVEPTELDAGFRSQVVLDIEHWRILAVERTTINGLPDFDIPAGSVTDYTLWR